MMRAIAGDSLAEFAGVYEPDVEMINVSRPQAVDALNQAAESLAGIAGFTEKWSQAANDATLPRAKFARYLDETASAAVADEIACATDMLGYLLDCKSVGIRVGALTRPMCPRFHVDKVACRLLMTLTGPGTEWIANPDVDFDLFVDRNTQLKPLKPGRAARVVDTGHWALLKGGLWREGFDGVVHRSPASSESRLMISIDPIFE